jgi:phenylpyruvate tautomerase PptA (4-oxalocrotonate tautomerase family)
MRGHIGYRLPRRIYDVYVTQLTVDVLTHDPETNEIYVSQLTVDVLTYDPEATEVYVSQLTVDVLTY